MNGILTSDLIGGTTGYNLSVVFPRGVVMVVGQDLDEVLESVKEGLVQRAAGFLRHAVYAAVWLCVRGMVERGSITVDPEANTVFIEFAPCVLSSMHNGVVLAQLHNAEHNLHPNTKGGTPAKNTSGAILDVEYTALSEFHHVFAPLFQQDFASLSQSCLDVANAEKARSPYPMDASNTCSVIPPLLDVDVVGDRSAAIPFVMVIVDSLDGAELPARGLKHYTSKTKCGFNETGFGCEVNVGASFYFSLYGQGELVGVKMRVLQVAFSQTAAERTALCEGGGETVAASQDFVYTGPLFIRYNRPGYYLFCAAGDDDVYTYIEPPQDYFAPDHKTYSNVPVLSAPGILIVEGAVSAKLAGNNAKLVSFSGFETRLTVAADELDSHLFLQISGVQGQMCKSMFFASASQCNTEKPLSVYNRYMRVRFYTDLWQYYRLPSTTSTQPLLAHARNTELVMCCTSHSSLPYTPVPGITVTVTPPTTRIFPSQRFEIGLPTFPVFTVGSAEVAQTVTLSLPPYASLSAEAFMPSLEKTFMEQLAAAYVEKLAHRGGKTFTNTEYASVRQCVQSMFATAVVVFAPTEEAVFDNSEFDAFRLRKTWLNGVNITTEFNPPLCKEHTSGLDTRLAAFLKDSHIAQYKNTLFPAAYIIETMRTARTQRAVVSFAQDVLCDEIHDVAVPVLFGERTWLPHLHINSALLVQDERSVNDALHSFAYAVQDSELAWEQNAHLSREPMLFPKYRGNAVPATLFLSQERAQDLVQDTPQIACLMQKKASTQYQGDAASLAMDSPLVGTGRDISRRFWAKSQGPSSLMQVTTMHNTEYLNGVCQDIATTENITVHTSIIVSTSLDACAYNAQREAAIERSVAYHYASTNMRDHTQGAIEEFDDVASFYPVSSSFAETVDGRCRIMANTRKTYKLHRPGDYMFCSCITTAYGDISQKECTQMGMVQGERRGSHSAVVLEEGNSTDATAVVMEGPVALVTANALRSLPDVNKYMEEVVEYVFIEMDFTLNVEIVLSSVVVTAEDYSELETDSTKAAFLSANNLKSEYRELNPEGIALNSSETYPYQDGWGTGGANGDTAYTRFWTADTTDSSALMQFSVVNLAMFGVNFPNATLEAICTDSNASVQITNISQPQQIPAGKLSGVFFLCYRYEEQWALTDLNFTVYDVFDWEESSLTKQATVGEKGAVVNFDDAFPNNGVPISFIMLPTVGDSPAGGSFGVTLRSNDNTLEFYGKTFYRRNTETPSFIEFNSPVRFFNCTFIDEVGVRTDYSITKIAASELSPMLRSLDSIEFTSLRLIGARIQVGGEAKIGPDPDASSSTPDVQFYGNSSIMVYHPTIDTTSRLVLQSPLHAVDYTLDGQLSGDIVAFRTVGLSAIIRVEYGSNSSVDEEVFGRVCANESEAFTKKFVQIDAAVALAPAATMEVVPGEGHDPHHPPQYAARIMYLHHGGALTAPGYSADSTLPILIDNSEVAVGSTMGVSYPHIMVFGGGQHMFSGSNTETNITVKGDVLFCGANALLGPDVRVSIERNASEEAEVGFVGSSLVAFSSGAALYILELDVRLEQGMFLSDVRGPSSSLFHTKRTSPSEHNGVTWDVSKFFLAELYDDVLVTFQNTLSTVESAELSAYQKRSSAFAVIDAAVTKSEGFNLIWDAEVHIFASGTLDSVASYSFPEQFLETVGNVSAEVLEIAFVNGTLASENLVTLELFPESVQPMVVFRKDGAFYGGEEEVLAFPYSIDVASSAQIAVNKTVQIAGPTNVYSRENGHPAFSSLDGQEGSTHLVLSGSHSASCGADTCYLAYRIHQMSLLFAFVTLPSGSTVLQTDSFLVVNSTLRSLKRDNRITAVDISIPTGSALEAEHLVLAGGVDFAGVLNVTLDQSIQIMDSTDEKLKCEAIIEVDGAVVFHEGAQMVCANQFDPTDARQDKLYQTVITWTDRENSNTEYLLPFEHCAVMVPDPDEEEEVSLIDVKTVRHVKAARLSFVFNNFRSAAEENSLEALTICLVVGLGAFFVLAPLVRQHASLSSLKQSFSSEPPVMIYLSWYDSMWKVFGFSNLFGTASMIWESWMLFCVAFHHDVPWPDWMGSYQDTAYPYFLLKGVDGHSYFILFIFIFVLVFAWILLWVPLMGVCQKKECDGDVSTPSVHEAGGKGGARVVRMKGKQNFWLGFFFVHKTVSTVVSVWILPILVVMLAPLDCYRNVVAGMEDRALLRHNVMRAYEDIVCWDNDERFFFLLIGGGIGAALLCLLTFESSSNRKTPFSHPPFRNHLDIRSKRVFEAVRTLVMLLQAIAVTAFYTNVMAMLFASICIQGFYLAVVRYSSPCIHYNVNRLRMALQTVALFALSTALIVVVRQGDRNEVMCESTYEWVTALFFVLNFAILVCFVYVGFFSDLDDATLMTSEELSLARCMVVSMLSQREKEKAQMASSITSSEGRHPTTSTMSTVNFTLTVADMKAAKLPDSSKAASWALTNLTTAAPVKTNPIEKLNTNSNSTTNPARSMKGSSSVSFAVPTGANSLKSTSSGGPTSTAHPTGGSTVSPESTPRGTLVRAKPKNEEENILLSIDHEVACLAMLKAVVRCKRSVLKRLLLEIDTLRMRQIRRSELRHRDRTRTFPPSSPELEASVAPKSDSVSEPASPVKVPLPNNYAPKEHMSDSQNEESNHAERGYVINSGTADRKSASVTTALPQSEDAQRERREKISRLKLQYSAELEAFRAWREHYTHEYYLGTHESLQNVLSSIFEAAPDEIARSVAYLNDLSGTGDLDLTPRLDAYADTLLGVASTVIERKAVAKREAEQELLVPEGDPDNATASAHLYDGWVKGQMLGRGSYGSVYVAVLRGGSLLAVKVIDLPPEGLPNVQELAAIQKEVNFIRELKHPNVIQYKACFLDKRQNAINIFMEYAVGGSLTSLVRKCVDPLPEAVVRVYIEQVLQGLLYLHSKNVIHRDIKGENVLLDTSGCVKLADFGCAKDLSGSYTKKTLGGTCVGSPYWMAPEVIQNKKYDNRCDIWSVGCTTLEVLNKYANFPPFLRQYL